MIELLKFPAEITIDSEQRIRMDGVEPDGIGRWVGEPGDTFDNDARAIVSW